MQRLWLSGTISAAGARLWIDHLFCSGERRPVEAVYAFALPRDAALRRFAIRGKGFEAHSELRPVSEAVAAYEKGVREGSLSGLMRQYRDGIVNLSVGNLQPREPVVVRLEILSGVEARDDAFTFRFPFTLAPCYHPRARAIEIAPGVGEMELPEDEFGDLLLPPFHSNAEGLHEVGFQLLVLMQDLAEVASPSHALSVRLGDGQAELRPAVSKNFPDRDLVVEIFRKKASAEVKAGEGKDGKKHFVAVVPSTSFVQPLQQPKRVAILLDRSGSMQGAQFTAAVKAVNICLKSLQENDHFWFGAFSNTVQTLSPNLLPATPENRNKALQFLDGVHPSGGTELASGILTAARLSGPGTDLIIITDGQVYATDAVVQWARAAGLRVHCLGIGSAGQDRFLTLLARETGGVTRSIVPWGKVEQAALQLIEAISRASASLIAIRNVTVQPEPPSVVLAGFPLVLYGEAERLPAEMEVQHEGGAFTVTLPDDGPQTGETLRLLKGARLITDLESRLPQEADKQKVKAALRALSETYGLASREMALVAVVKRESDQAEGLPHTQVIPVGMPQDVATLAYFQDVSDCEDELTRRLRLGWNSISCARLHPDYDYTLHQLLWILEEDGGVLGGTAEERAHRTLIVLLAFLQKGHSVKSKPYQRNVRGMIRFLSSSDITGQLTGEQQEWVKKAIWLAREGKAPPGDWSRVTTMRFAASWKEIGAAIDQAANAAQCRATVASSSKGASAAPPAASRKARKRTKRIPAAL